MGATRSGINDRDPVPVTSRRRPPEELSQKTLTQLQKFMRRVGSLTDGRYQITITVNAEGLADWSVTALGKVEK